MKKYRGIAAVFLRLSWIRVLHTNSVDPVVCGAGYDAFFIVRIRGLCKVSKLLTVAFFAAGLFAAINVIDLFFSKHSGIL